MSDCGSLAGLKRLFFAGFGCSSPALDEDNIFGGTHGAVASEGPQPDQVERGSYRNGVAGDGALAVIFRASASDLLGKQAIRDAIQPTCFGHAKVEWPLRVPGQAAVPADKQVHGHAAPVDLNAIEKLGGLVQRREDAEWKDGKKVVHCADAVTSPWVGVGQASLAWHFAAGGPLEAGYKNQAERLSTREGAFENIKVIVGADSAVDVDLSKQADVSTQPGHPLSQMASMGERGFALVWSDKTLPRPDKLKTTDHLYEIVGSTPQGLELADAEGNRYEGVRAEQLGRAPHVFVVTWGGNALAWPSTH